MQKKRVQVAPDRAEALVEDSQERDDVLDLRGGELPVSSVGPLVLLAEYLQPGKGLRGIVVVRQHPFEAYQLAELEKKTAGQPCGLRFAGEQDFVQDFLRLRELPFTDLVEEVKRSLPWSDR